jgi:hypothetical protein
MKGGFSSARQAELEALLSFRSLSKQLQNEYAGWRSLKQDTDLLQCAKDEYGALSTLVEGVDVNSEGRVTRLDLRNKGIEGEIDWSRLFSMAALEWIWLGDNKLCGILPPELGTVNCLPNLKRLWIQNNSDLRGKIAVEFASKKGVSLDVSGSQVQDVTSEEIARFKSLRGRRSDLLVLLDLVEAFPALRQSESGWENLRPEMDLLETSTEDYNWSACGWRKTILAGPVYVTAEGRVVDIDLESKNLEGPCLFF